MPHDFYPACSSNENRQGSLSLLQGMAHSATMQGMSAPTVYMTSRERHCKKVMRNRAWRKRSAQIRLYSRIALSLACVSGLVLTFSYHPLSNAISAFYQQQKQAFYQHTAAWGLSVSHIYVHGRERTSLPELQHALGIAPEDPILAFNVSDIESRLEHLSYVKDAMVERTLPDTVHITLTERKPTAVWQLDGALSLIDEEGEIITSTDMYQYHTLPLVIGNKAPEHIRTILAIIHTTPKLAKDIYALTFVSERRWDVRLRSGVTIKLPEQAPERAWERLADLQKSQQLLERYIETVDLRDKTRIFITLPYGDVEALDTLPSSKAAKET